MTQVRYPFHRWSLRAVESRRPAYRQRHPWNLRDVFVSPEDVAAVLGSALAPHVFDWVARAFMGPSR
jgi:hypothetical protein